MKSFFVFLWRATIPILWLLSVLAAIRGGFQPGLVPPPPVGETYPYPWKGVVFVSVVTAIESASLFLILRPHKFNWSLARVGAAVAVFIALSVYVIFTTATDHPGYDYVPGNYTLFLTFLLFILLIITSTISIVKWLQNRVQRR